MHTNTVPLLAAVFKIFAAISIYKGIFYLYLLGRTERINELFNIITGGADDAS